MLKIISHTNKVTAALAFLLAAGFGTQTAGAVETAKPVSGGELVYFQDLEPSDWDLSHDWPVSLLTLGGNVFDRLIYLGSDGVYYTWLAESWDSTEDGKALTFHLRKDVKFHNNEKFDAHAVALNIDKWVADTNSWNPTGVGLVDYTVIDDYTIRLNLKKRNAAVKWLISTASWAFLAPETLKNHAGDISGDFAAQIGTGPFKVESYTRGQKVVLVKNPDYHWAPANAENKGTAYLDKITVNFVKDPAVRLGALQSGQADVIANVPSVYLTQLGADKRFEIHNKQATGVPYQLWLNTEAAPTNDLRVRKAFRAALDIKTALNTIYFGHYPQAWSLLAENTPPVNSYNKALENAWSYDLEGANKLLDEAGWNARDDKGYRTKDGKRLELKWAVKGSTIEDQRDTLGEALQALARKAGIALVRDVYDNGTYSKTLKAGDYNLTDRPWSTADVYVVTNAVFSGTSSETGGNNYIRIKDPEVDRLARPLTDSKDDNLRAKNAQELQKLAAENVWSIPIYARQVNIGAKKTVHGVAFDIAGWLDSWHGAWIER